MMQKSLQRCYTEFLGSGNINSEYWFVAIEPALDKNDETIFQILRDGNNEEIIQYFNSAFDDVVGPSQVYNNVYRILEKFGLKKNILTENGIRKVSFCSDGDAFYTNLSPLKFPHLDSNENISILKKYHEIFYDFNKQLLLERNGNFSRLSLYNFNNNNWIRIRKEKISKYFKQKCNRVIFILARSQSEFVELLFDEVREENKLDDYSLKTKYGNSEISFYKKSNVYILLPNFKISDEHICEIYSRVNKILMI